MRVFTHRSFAARPTHVFEDSPEDPSPDNEQFSPVSLRLFPPLTICYYSKGLNMSAIRSLA
jgi:hypothetical protein